MTKTMRRFLPVMIIGVMAIIAIVILQNPKQSDQEQEPADTTIAVETLTIMPEDYQVYLDSFGLVRPRTQSALLPQVAGQITYISENFREGGFFEKGDLLVQIDDRDYKANVKIAEAGLLTAKQALSEEQARARQALEDWQRLGNDEAPNDLVLRKPQLEAASATLLSAQAALDMAKLSLDRTQIRAPFQGRVLQQNADVGQVISSGSTLAVVYATDYVEVRLPIRNRDLAFIELPENGNNNQNTMVDFQSDLIGSQNWLGKIVRTEGAIDNASQQLYVVAQIDEPFGSQVSGHIPIKIGQYLTAQIKGSQLKNAILVPNTAIYQASYVFVVNEGLLQRREISTSWQNEQDAIISAGLEFGDQLVITPLGQVSSGTPVNITRTLSSLTQFHETLTATGEGS